MTIVMVGVPGRTNHMYGPAAHSPEGANLPVNLPQRAFAMDKDDERDIRSDYSYSQVVAPVFAAFSLPAIITFAPTKYPGPPWHNIVLSLLVIATGSFMASIGLTSRQIRKKWPVGAGYVRVLLTMIGICVVAGALFALGLPAIGQWWAPLVLSPLLIGSIVPAGITTLLWLRQHRSRHIE